MGLAGCGMMLSSCQETQDDAPVYKDPTTFVLNTPPMAANFYELAPGGTIELTCSQPDYGFGASVVYSVEMAVDEAFTDFRPVTPNLPTSARIQLAAEDVAAYICELLNVTGDTYNAADNVVSLYFRAVAALPQVESSRIVSNVVKLERVQYYLAVKEPAYIYVVGAFTGIGDNWVEPNADNSEHYMQYRLYEADNAIGSKVFSAVFDVPAGKAMFRFYTALTGWDADSYGSQADDNPIDYEMTDGVFEGLMVKGKGCYNFPAWEGGQMTMTVNMASDKMTVTFQAGAVDTTPKEVIYICGNITGWSEPSEDNASKYENARLTDQKGDGIFTATFDLPDSGDGKSYFRFYKELTGWGAAQWASPTGDNYDLPLGQPTATAVGEGCFVLPAGSYAITVDSNNNTVMAVAAE